MIQKMLGSFLSRTLLMVFGYAYPAYECFKIVKNAKNSDKSQTENLLTWCQFWILVAIYTVFERIGDVFFSWLPLYSEAKLGFLIYLWSSKMKGMKYIYTCFFQPYMTRHEEDIDRNLLEIKSKAGNFAIHYWKQALIIGQTKFLEILKTISSNDSLISLHPNQGKATTVSNENNVKETCGTEKTERKQEDNVSLLENEDSEPLEHETNTDKEATLLKQSKWRKMFSSSSDNWASAQ